MFMLKILMQVLLIGSFLTFDCQASIEHQQDSQRLDMAQFYIAQCPKLDKRLALAAYFHFYENIACKDEFIKTYLADCHAVKQGSSIENSAVLQHINTWTANFKKLYIDHPELQKYSLEDREYALHFILERTKLEIFLQSYEQDSKNNRLSSGFAKLLVKSVEGVEIERTTNMMLCNFKEPMESQWAYLENLPNLPVALKKSYQFLQNKELHEFGYVAIPALFNIACEVVKKQTNISLLHKLTHDHIAQIINFYRQFSPIVNEVCQNIEEKKYFLLVLNQLSQTYEFPRPNFWDDEKLIQTSVYILSKELLCKKKIKDLCAQEELIKKKQIEDICHQEDLKRKQIKNNAEKMGAWLVYMARNQLKIERDYDCAISRLIKDTEFDIQKNFQNKETVQREYYVKESDTFFKDCCVLKELLRNQEQMLKVSSVVREKLWQSFSKEPLQFLRLSPEMRQAYVNNQSFWAKLLKVKVQKTRQQQTQEGPVSIISSYRNDLYTSLGINVSPVQSEQAERVESLIDVEEQNDGREIARVASFHAVAQDSYEFRQRAPHCYEYTNVATRESWVVRRHNPYALPQH